MIGNVAEAGVMQQSPAFFGVASRKQRLVLPVSAFGPCGLASMQPRGPCSNLSRGVRVAPRSAPPGCTEVEEQAFQPSHKSGPRALLDPISLGPLFFYTDHIRLQCCTAVRFTILNFSNLVRADISLCTGLLLQPGIDCRGLPSRLTNT
jgi:hypothetical protein